MLSDAKRRRLYDSGLYDPVEDEEEEIEVSWDKNCQRIGLIIPRNITFNVLFPS